MADNKTEQAVADEKQVAKKLRSRLSQDDVPTYSLDQALRVPRAIAENYAYKPTRPLNVAGAMSVTPTSGGFRTLTGSAMAYGLTTGAAQAPEIAITPLGLRIVRPTVEGDDIAAKREALLRPKIIGDFLRNYDGAALPSDAIAKNVLQEMGVPSDRLDDVLKLIVEGAKAVGFIKEWSGKSFVDLAGQASVPETSQQEDDKPAESNATIQHAQPPVAPTPPVAVSMGGGVHVNIEIHIAADASTDTIEDIFRSMRRYVLNGDEQSDDSTTSEK